MDTKQPIEVNQLVREYVAAFPAAVRVDGVFLFGSFARGDAREDSDVDLVVLSDDFRDMPFIKRLEFLSKMRRAPSTRTIGMDIFGYTPDEWQGLENESSVIRQAKREGRFVWKREKEGA